jgi:hygromycin-B 7''-O-kinase
MLVADDLARAIARRHGLHNAGLARVPYGENLLFETAECVIKIFGPARNQYRRELASLRALERCELLETPRVLAAGELDGRPYVVMTRLRGVRLTQLWSGLSRDARRPIVVRMAEAMRELHALPVAELEASLDRDWDAFIDAQTAGALERQRDAGAPEEWLAALPAWLDDCRALLLHPPRRVLLHGDIHAGNLLVREEHGAWQLTGWLDFGDSFAGPPEYELVAPGVLMVQGDAELQRDLLLAYGYDERALTAALRHRLMLLTICYECSNLRKYAERLRPDAVQLSLAELEQAIWSFATPA